MKKTFFTTLCLVIALFSYSQDNYFKVKNLYLEPTSISNSGWHVTKLFYRGHSLDIGPPQGAFSHSTVNFYPGTYNGPETISTAVNMYTSNSLTTYNKKIQLNTAGITFFNGGNVGIGTETPQQKLDVAGNIQGQTLIAGPRISDGPGEIIRLRLIPYRHTGGNWDFVSRDTPSEAFLDINYGIASALTMRRSTYKTCIGIGTKSPQNGLDVAGTIRATEVKIEALPWADFVFDKNYKLRSLEEVKAHIDEHKHLPDIPSEAEVKENGISLGEMQSKLLQKIEELTLYMIEQNKKIEIQSQEIEQLKKENLKIKEEINRP